MQKSITNSLFFLEILQFKESCTLTGQGHSEVYLKKKEFTCLSTCKKPSHLKLVSFWKYWQFAIWSNTWMPNNTQLKLHNQFIISTIVCKRVPAPPPPLLRHPPLDPACPAPLVKIFGHAQACLATVWKKSRQSFNSFWRYWCFVIWKHFRHAKSSVTTSIQNNITIF